MPELAEDWRPSIVAMVRAKQALAAVDVDGIFPFHSPKVAAPPAAIEALEAERVLWLAGEEVDRFDSFGSYFESMIQYNLDTIDDVRVMRA